MITAQPQRFVLLAVLLASLSACQAQQGKPPKISSELHARIDALIQRSLQNMRRIEGGGFWMGDFGVVMTDEEKAKDIAPGPEAQIRPGQLPFTVDQDNKPPRWFTLDTFYIGAYKVTYGDFDVYVAANGLPAHPPQGDEDWEHIWRKMRTGDNVPAGVHWNQAKSYCQWLGKLTGLPVDLPTEAQWEFAASNRTNSYWKPFPTQSGQRVEGKTSPSFKHKEELLGRSWVYPVGLFEPSPAGLYDLLGNGFDWVQDWYAPAYAAGPSHNPTGPASGTHKVLRGEPSNESPSAHRYLTRKPQLPMDAKLDWNGVEEPVPYGNEGFRCAVHRGDLTPSPKP